MVNAERVLRPGWDELGGAERGLRRLGTWRRPSGARGPAAQQPRRPRSSNPFQRAQEDEWRRRNKTVLTYVAAAAVGMLGASYAAVPLYRLYCQVREGTRRRTAIPPCPGGRGHPSGVTSDPDREGRAQGHRKVCVWKPVPVMMELVPPLKGLLLQPFCEALRDGTADTS